MSRPGGGPLAVPAPDLHQRRPAGRDPGPAGRVAATSSCRSSSRTPSTRGGAGRRSPTTSGSPSPPRSRCTSARPGRTPGCFTQGTNWYNPSIAGTHAQTDYAASIGGNSESNGFLQKTWNDGGMNKLRDPIRLTDMVDGLSNTLMVGDKRLPIDRMGGFQGEDNEGYTSGWDHDVLRRTDLLPLPTAWPRPCPGARTASGSGRPTGRVQRPARRRVRPVDQVQHQRDDVLEPREPERRPGAERLLSPVNSTGAAG